MKPAITTIDTDFLCIGGGIAGLMGAIRAAELGAKVIVAEKGNAKYSGAGATGNDHFQCYIPDYHGDDFDGCVAELMNSQQGTLRDMKFIHAWLSNSFDMVKLWDSWGIPMKYEGRWEFAGHGMPGDKLNHLHYAGKFQKQILVREAVKRGAEVMNRIMCFDLLRDEHGVCGALAINTRTGEIIHFRAKGVLLGTGSSVRLYPGCTPSSMFNTRLCPNTCGDGRAMGFRVGAELTNLELPVLRCGPAYFARAGKATWGGVLRDPHGKPAGPFITKPNNKYGDAVVEIYQHLFVDFKKNGTGPVYMDCTGLDEDEVKYMVHWLDNEGNGALLSHLEKEGLYVGTTPIEFRSYDTEFAPRGGVLYDETGRSSLPGLYVAGEEFGGGIANAAVFGWLAGENAAADVKSVDLRDGATDSPMLENLEKIRAREIKSGTASWQEANHALQQIMGDYAGLTRSETMLKAGQDGLRRLRKKAVERLVAPTPHELYRCAEVLNLMEVGNLVFTAARERKETRLQHNRIDYPFTHPHYKKWLILRRDGENIIKEWRGF